MVTVRIPGPDSVPGVAPGRDPGVRSSPEDFGAQIGRAMQGLGSALAGVGQTADQLRKQRQAAVDRMSLASLDLDLKEIEANDLPAMQNQAGPDIDGFESRWSEHYEAVSSAAVKRYAPRLSPEAMQRAELLRRGSLIDTRIKAQTFENNETVARLAADLDRNQDRIAETYLRTGDLDAALAVGGEQLAAADTFLDARTIENRRDTLNGKLLSAWTARHKDQVAAIEQQVGTGAMSLEDGRAALDGLYAQAERLGPDAAPFSELRRNDDERLTRAYVLEPAEAGERRARADAIYGRLPKGYETPKAGGSGNLVDRIVGVESGGRATAKNPRSSAYGAGQFIKSTWASFISERHPELQARGDVQKLRSDPALAREAVAWYAEKNGAELAAAGLPVRDGTLYLAHFAGPEGAKALLRADPNASAASVLGADALKANPFMRGKTAADMVAWADKKMGGAAPVRVASVEGRTATDAAPTNPNLAARVDVEREIGRREKEVDTLRSAERVRLASDLDDYVAWLRAGNEPDPERFPVAQIAEVLDPEDAAEAQAAVAEAERFGAKAAALRWAGPEEAAAIISSEAERLQSPEDFRQASKDVAALTGAWEERNRRLVDDPAQYAAQNPHIGKAFQAVSEALAADDADPAMARQAVDAYAALTLTQQEKLGLPPEAQRILPNSMRDLIVRQFRSQEQGGQNAAQMMRSLQDQWGRNWPKVFSELSAGEGLPSVALVVGTMNRPDQMRAAEQLAEAALIGRKKLEDLRPDADVRESRGNVNAAMAPFRQTLAVNPGGAQTYLAFEEGVTLLALSYMAGGDPPGVAANRAYQDVIGRKYTMRDTFRVPVEHDAGQVARGASRMLGNLRGLPIDAPLSLAGLPEEEAREAYIRAVQSTGFWVTAPDESGLRLYDETQAVVTADGEPVGFTWEELTRREAVPEAPLLDTVLPEPQP